MKENAPTPETVSTPPPLTTKDSLSVEVEEIRERILDFSQDGYLRLDDIDALKRLLSIVDELRKERDELRDANKRGNAFFVAQVEENDRMMRAEQDKIGRLRQELDRATRELDEERNESTAWDKRRLAKLAAAQAQLRRKDEALEAIQEENSRLSIYVDLYNKAVKACLFIHSDESLGLIVGQSITTDGVTALKNQRDLYREALEKLSKLGNGDLCGNSVGNQIARAALADGKECGR